MRLFGVGIVCTILLLLIGCSEHKGQRSSSTEDAKKCSKLKKEQSDSETKEGGDEMITEFIMAAEDGETDQVLGLLQRGVDINATDGKGRTALIAATHGNKPDTIKALINAGADLNLRDHRNDNPLLSAGASGMLEIVKIMVEAGADTSITNRFGGTALIPAADRGHVEVVKYLLEHSDVDIDHINNLGWTALLEAIILGDGGKRHTQIVELLANHGANVNLADGEGVTPLQHAVNRDYRAMVAILEEAGAK